MSSQRDEPVFTHDCSGCTFVKRWNGHDIYTCVSGGMVTVVARWGNGGPDYSSHTVWLDTVALKANGGLKI